MNNNYIKLFLLIVSFTVFLSCEEDSKDDVKPTIDLSVSGAFPVNCDTIYFGETFTLKILFTDNVELGSFSIDIHHNFDHHSHSTEVTECNSDPDKEPVNPYVFIQDYDIPQGLTEYETNIEINIPSTENSILLDEGDYHFYISLTDKQGWSEQKGLSIKMLHR